MSSPWTCPGCGHSHSRGYFPLGTTSHRCLHCGYVGDGEGDPTCNICLEPRSAHVPSSDGPLTCPRVARGEGIFVLDRPGYTMSGAMGGFPGDDDIEIGSDIQVRAGGTARESVRPRVESVPMRWWAVNVEGFMTSYFQAATRDKARFLAFRSLHECGYVQTFRDFLARVGAVRAAHPDEVAAWT